MTIAIDFDGVMNNLPYVWCEELHENHNIVSEHRLDNYDMTKNYPELSNNQIYGPLYKAEFWDKVKPNPYCIDILKRLKQFGNDILIVTATDPRCWDAKYNHCIEKYFSFIPLRDIIITARKDLIDCDVIVDDWENNLSHCNAIRVLFDQPYNLNASISSFDYRVHNWNELYRLIVDFNQLGIFKN